MCNSLQEALHNAFLPSPPRCLGVAVSGGGDSLALLLLLEQFCAQHGVTLRAATVDHGLRKEAADEARTVATLCSDRGIAHRILTLPTRPKGGNLQAFAREGRYSALANWARSEQIKHIALGHTADDQAETVLMGLARRSGVDGLAAMPPRMTRHGMTWVRPLLGVRRETLRGFLRKSGVSWVEDPSNTDSRFERVRVRQALALLEPLGAGTEALVEVAEHMRDARAALEWQAFLAAQDLVTIQAGALRIRARGFSLLPVEIRRRLVIRALRWLKGGEVGPRKSALKGILDALTRGKSATAEGCHLQRVRGNIWIFRELRPLSDQRVKAGEVWDGRWRFMPNEEGLAEEDLTIAAVGEKGLNQCPDWRDLALPRPVLLSLPGLWRGDALQAAPLVCINENWHPQLIRDENAFFATFLAH